MIVPIAELIDALSSSPKAYLGQPFAFRTYYNARHGKPLTFRTAQQFLALARERDPQVVGLRLADGSVVYHAEALAALAERNAALEREVALLRLQLMRKIVGGARAHFAN